MIVRKILMLIFFLNSLIVFSQSTLILGNAFDDGLKKYIHFKKLDSIIEYRFKAKLEDGKIVKGYEFFGRAKTIIRFDENAKVIELKNFIDTNLIGNTYTYQYDSEKKLINSKW
jgi:hypothetical protein